MQLRKVLPAAFALTLPVMAGFLVFGTAYGVLMQSAGFGVGWVFLSSLLVYAGSMQFVGIGF
jgi:predicted branched-subunit amino acid permease